MALEKEIYKSQRLVLVRFRRAAKGNPDAARPDLDDRGYTLPDYGPVVGLIEDHEITVHLIRENIDKEAKLYVASDAPKVVEILALDSKAPLPDLDTMHIRLKGIEGVGDPKTAKIQVRFGSDTGPIIHELTAWVFKPYWIRIKPHLVTISQTGGGAAAVTTIAGTHLKDIWTLVRAIWKPCGVQFSILPTSNDNIPLTTAGFISDSGGLNDWREVHTLLNTNWVPKSVNVYFVPRISSNTLGYGLDKKYAKKEGLPHPGIVVADTESSMIASGRARDAMWWANTLAHELGHFFQLWHPEKKNDAQVRKDTWSKRLVMHNYYEIAEFNNWKDNVGYGYNRRGCLISMKDLPQLITDGECSTARSAIKAGPY